MAFSLTLAAPFIREFTITPTTVFIGTKRLCLYLNLWSRLRGAPAFEWSKDGGDLSLRIGPISLEISVPSPALSFS